MDHIDEEVLSPEPPILVEVYEQYEQGDPSGLVEHFEQYVLEGDEAISLWSQGVDAWNEWYQDHPHWRVDFSGVDFDAVCDETDSCINFEYFHFPKDVIFDHVMFSDREVLFNHCVFSDGKVSFRYTKFGQKKVFFENTQFGNSDVYFNHASFDEGGVSFNNAEFAEGEVYFENVGFDKGYVSFENTHFGRGDIYFNGAQFGDKKVSFRNTNFGNGIVNFSYVNLSGANFDYASLKYGNFTGAILKSANFLNVSMKKATFDRADLSECNLSNISFQGDGLILAGANVKNLIIDRYSIECLHDYGKLSVSEQMMINIQDGAAILRHSFRGVWRAAHLVTLTVFLFPYLWFILHQWNSSTFQPNSDVNISLFKAITLFVYNGGQNMSYGNFNFHWSFSIFISVLIYCCLRSLLFWKSKKLDFNESIMGLPSVFSIQNSNWGKLYKIVVLGLGVNILLVAANTYHFLLKQIPLASL